MRTYRTFKFTSPAYVKPRGTAETINRGSAPINIPMTDPISPVSEYMHRSSEYVSYSSEYIPRPKAEDANANVKSKTKVKTTSKASSIKHTKPTATKKKLALLLPGHNEELIIATTISSAVTAGQDIEDIFVVDDASDDKTRKIAVSLLGKDNVLTVRRSGKALAVKKAIKKFHVERDYEWLHVADADSVFSPTYFHAYRAKLDPTKYAVAVGFVQSLRGNWISTYRALTYTYSQHVNRRIQSYLGMISVFPGPITCFRTDIIKDLDFDSDTITEDFDITVQFHRKRLGKIVFIPKAINYTQDPQTLRDFCKQTQRWQRGFFQCVKKYGVGLHPQRLDVSLGFQMFQSITLLFQIFVLFPIIILTTHSWLSIPVAISADFILNSAIAIWASVLIRRWTMVGAMPYFYFLRWIEIGIYFWAFVEVMILHRFRSKITGWATEGRRYKLDMSALQDIAVK
jgi:cellulose synthase/poly-beta-1,6-N-acetylglucosamine synthase-like glycosyltransferase